MKLLQLELIKIKTYRTFWVIFILYFLLTGIVYFSGKIFLDYIAEKGSSIEGLNPANIPLYTFPDIWHNLTWVAGLFKFIFAFFVIISITNEINYGTLRQNILNGLTRSEFLKSKMFLIIGLSLLSTVFIIICGFVLGLVYSKLSHPKYLFYYFEFVPAYFLEFITYLTFALFVGLLIKRSGLSMILFLMYSYMIEPIITFNIDNKIEFLKEFFPMYAMRDLIQLPFKKYLLQEVQDYVAIGDTLIVCMWLIIFTGLSYLLLKKRDL